MSPRAAARLEALGFAAVYDYAGGKNDWLAAGLPREGASTEERFAGDVAEEPDDLAEIADEQRIVHAHLTTVRANEPLEPLLEHMRDARLEFVPVTDPDGRLLGIVR